MKVIYLLQSVAIGLLLSVASASFADDGYTDAEAVSEDLAAESEFTAPSDELEVGYYFIRSEKYVINSFNVNAWGDERYFTAKIRYKVYYRDQFGQIRLATKYAHLEGDIFKTGPDIFQSDTQYTTIGAEICQLPIRLIFRKTAKGFQLKLKQPLKILRGCLIESYQTTRVQEEYLLNSLRRR